MVHVMETEHGLVSIGQNAKENWELVSRAGQRGEPHNDMCAYEPPYRNAETCGAPLGSTTTTTTLPFCIDTCASGPGLTGGAAAAPAGAAPVTHLISLLEDDDTRESWEDEGAPWAVHDSSSSSSSHSAGCWGDTCCEGQQMGHDCAGGAIWGDTMGMGHFDGFDTWFHVKSTSSAHVLLHASDDEDRPSRAAIMMCASLAKEHSKMRHVRRCKVMFAPAKNVRRADAVGSVTVTKSAEVTI